MDQRKTSSEEAHFEIDGCDNKQNYIDFHIHESLFGVYYGEVAKLVQFFFKW